jgi:ATP-binding cassette ChvD family protein
MPAPQKPASRNETQIIYSMIGVTKEIDRRKILKDVSVSYYYGAKIGVLGLNGSGKSTLLRIMAGVDRNYEGKVVAAGGYSIGYLEQEPLIDDTRTVIEVVRDGAKDTFALLREYDEINARFGEDMTPEQMDKLINKQAQVQEKLDRIDAWTIDSQLEMAMEALRCPPPDQAVNTLSGGERRRVALCRLLLTKPDILLLDEPTNHLDAESVAWLEQHLQRFEGTIIAATHDRYFLDNVAGWILELDRGRGIPYEGNYTSWLEQKDKRFAQEQKQEQAHQRAIKAELEWVRTNPKGRQAKSKARLARFEELQSREFQKRNETIELYIPPGPRLGDKVIELDHITKGYDGRVLIEDLSFAVPQGAIVGIIGGNGAGKTTLFRMIAGQEKPEHGAVTVGPTVQLAYVEQFRDTLDPKKTVWEEVSQKQDIIKIGQYEVPSRAYVGRFNFKGTDQQKMVGNLSGGERNRLHLAKLLREGGNVLLLDEPTNDLDVETLRALEEALLNFPGVVLVISHDRWFLDRIATHVLAFEGDSHVEWFEGNFSDYEVDRKKRLAAQGVDVETPHRLRYRKLDA